MNRENDSVVERKKVANSCIKSDYWDFVGLDERMIDGN
jgi:hypothetical protein